ncbi:MAG: ArnT family glycosyltransferase [Solirubrobacteraceae bacterium]
MQAPALLSRFPRTSRRRALVLAILVAALAIRVAGVAATPGYAPRHDDHSYDHLALGVARNGDFPVVGDRPTAYRPPGFPYVLGAVYAIAGSGHDRITVARYVQAVIGTILVGLIGMLAWWSIGAAAGLWAMVIAAVYIPLVAVGAALLSEPMFAALMLGALLCVLGFRRTAGQRPGWTRLRWALLAGALGGALSLTRTNGLVVLIALALGLWTGRPAGVRWRSWRAVAPVLAMLAAAVVAIAPWAIRNEIVMHTFIPVSDEQGGTLAGTYNPVSDHDPVAPASWHLLTQIPDYYARSRAQAARPEPQLQSRLTSLALRYVRHHPLYPLKVAFYNGVRLLDLGGLHRAEFTAISAGVTSPGVADAGVVCFWIVALLALAGLAMRRVRRSLPGFLWLAAALVLASILFVNTETPRFRVPLDPFFILIAAGALAAIAERVGRPRPGRRTGAEVA